MKASIAFVFIIIQNIFHLSCVIFELNESSKKDYNEYKLIVNSLNVYAHYTNANVKEIFIPLLKRLTKLQKEKSKRILVILAAPPGSGKSIICTYLEKLSKEREEFTNIQCIGMDDFHYHQDYLNSHSTIRNGEEILLAKIKEVLKLLIYLFLLKELKK